MRVVRSLVNHWLFHGTDKINRRGTESNESIVRYAAYASRIKTLLYSMQRYVAYTSDIKESLRPLARPNLIRGAYAISWSYMLGDAAHEGHKAYRCNQVIHPRRRQQPVRENRGNDTEAADIAGTTPGITPALEGYRTVAMQRFLFHCMASMALPAFTVQHIVRYTNNVMRSVKSKALRTGGPLVASLLVMPFFPRVFDKPVEKAVEWIFYKGFQKLGGQDAVGHALQTGRTEQLRARAAALGGSGDK